MTKEQLIKIIALEFSADDIDVAKYFDSIFETISLAFKKNKNVNIGEFGKFILRTKTTKQGIKSKIISFAPSRKFALDVNSNFNDLIPVKIRSLTEKKLKESYFEPDEADEIILIESEDELMESEITEQHEIALPGLYDKPELNVPAEEKAEEVLYEKLVRLDEESIDITQEVRIDEDRDELEKAIAAYNESVISKLAKTAEITQETKTAEIIQEEKIDVIIPEEKIDEIIQEEKIDVIIPEEKTDLIIPEEKIDEIIQEEKIDVIIPEEKIDVIIPEEKIDEIIQEEKIDVIIPEEEIDVIIPEEKIDVIIQEEKIDVIIPEEKPDEIIQEEKQEPEIIPDEIIKSESEIEEESKLPDKTDLEILEEEFITFTKQQDISDKTQDVFSDVDLLLKELMDIKGSIVTGEQVTEVPEELNDIKQESSAEPGDSIVIPEAESEKKEEIINVEEERKLEEELQRMLEEREKILMEIRQLESDSWQVKEIDTLINKFSKETDDLLDVNFKPVVAKDINLQGENKIIHDESFDERLRELLVTPEPEITESPDFSKSFDISDLTLQSYKSESESDVIRKNVENPELKIFDKLTGESYSYTAQTEKPFDGFDSLKDHFEEISLQKEFGEGLEDLEKQFESLSQVQRAEEIKLPASLADAFVNIELPDKYIRKPQKFISDEQKIKNYNDIFKPVESFQPKTVQSVPKTNVEKIIPEKKKSGKKLLIVLLLLFIAVIIIIFIARSRKPENIKNEISTNKTDTVSIEKKVDVESEKVKDASTKDEKIIYEENGVYFKQNSKGIFIQVGTFINEKEAIVKAFLLKSQKLNAEVERINLGQNELRYRVKIGPYSTLEEAKATFESLKK